MDFGILIEKSLYNEVGQKLRLTSEFNEVSKTRAGGRFFEANHKKYDDLEAEKFGWKKSGRRPLEWGPDFWNR